MTRIAFSKRLRGSNLVETPLAIFIVLVCLLLPMLILVTLTIRVGLFWTGVREAAKAASERCTFEQDAGTEDLSAINAAKSVAQKTVGAFNGISLDHVDLYIVVTPVDTGGVGAAAVGAANTKLTEPGDTSKNAYEVRVEFVGTADPLVGLPSSVFGEIPGLTKGFPLTMVSQRVIESPQRWNY